MGGGVLTSWPIRSKLSKKYFTDSPCAGETHTAQSRPRGPGPAGRTRVGTLWSPWRREGVHGRLRLTLLSQNGRFTSSNPQIQTQTLAQWPCPVPAGAGPSGQATGPARRGSTVWGRHPSEGLGHIPGRSPAADEVTHCAAHVSPAVRLRAAEGRRVWPLDTGPACPGRSAQPQGCTRLRLGRPQCRLRPPGVLWTDRPGRLPPGRRRTLRTAQAVSGEPGHPRQRHWRVHRAGSGGARCRPKRRWGPLRSTMTVPQKGGWCKHAPRDTRDELSWVPWVLGAGRRMGPVLDAPLLWGSTSVPHSREHAEGLRGRPWGRHVVTAPARGLVKGGQVPGLPPARPRQAQGRTEGRVSLSAGRVDLPVLKRSPVGRLEGSVCLRGRSHAVPAGARRR